MSKPIKKVLGYIRVSKEVQETMRQRHELKQYCERQGWEVAELLEEPAAISGRSKAVRKCPNSALFYYNALIGQDYAQLERPEFSRMLKLVETEEYDAVVFYALDRFSRDTVELLLLDLILKVYGTKLIAISQGGEVHTDTAAGKFMYRVMAAQAEMELDQISERTKSALDAKKAAQGPPLRAKRGQVLKDGKISDDHCKKMAMAAAARWKEKGYTLQYIADELDVSRTTVSNYLKTYREMKHA